MNLTLKEKIDRLLSLEESAKNEREIRELVSEVFSRSDELYELTETTASPGESERILSLCLRKLRAMNNDRISRLNDCGFLFVELDRLLESVCLCCDILLGDKGKKLHLDAEHIAVSCCPQLIIDAFLNLISNAVKFSDGDIRCSLGSGKHQCVLTVAESGKSALLPLRPKNGLLSVQNTARLHSGRLLFSETRGGNFSAELAISTSLPHSRRYRTPPFTGFLEDRLSAVHVGLCDCLS